MPSTFSSAHPLQEPLVVHTAAATVADGNTAAAEEAGSAVAAAAPVAADKPAEVVVVAEPAVAVAAVDLDNAKSDSQTPALQRRQETCFRNQRRTLYCQDLVLYNLDKAYFYLFS